MKKTVTTLLMLGGMAGVFGVGACHKNESRSTTIYNSTNDPNPAGRDPSEPSIADDDWDFVAPQGKMVVDPE